MGVVNVCVCVCVWVGGVSVSVLRMMRRGAQVSEVAESVCRLVGDALDGAREVVVGSGDEDDK